jgi:hypothetical protein
MIKEIIIVIIFTIFIFYLGFEFYKMSELTKEQK